MLYLTRKAGQTVVINDAIEVTVVEVRGRAVKLGFTFPSEATVLRKEIHEKIKRENIEAARASAALAEVDIDSAELSERLAQKPAKS
jgi:carbon storage regulator